MHVLSDFLSFHRDFSCAVCLSPPLSFGCTPLVNMAMHLQRRELLKATTSSPFTRDFRHLLKFPRYWLTRQSFREPIIKSVRPKDRIKYWNIVPGDKIADLRDPTKKLYEVLSINKLSNKVFLKGTSRMVRPYVLGYARQNQPSIRYLEAK